MAHPGAYPIDHSTLAGQLRVLLGDTTSKALVPPVAGQADYNVWSDSDLETALVIASDSIYRAAGDLYMSIAAYYAQKGRSIKTDDLALNSLGRSGDILAIAKQFHAQAGEIAQAEADDFFELVSTGRQGGTCRAEGSPWPRCDCGLCF